MFLRFVPQTATCEMTGNHTTISHRPLSSESETTVVPWWKTLAGGGSCWLLGGGANICLQVCSCGKTKKKSFDKMLVFTEVGSR